MLEMEQSVEAIGGNRPPSGMTQVLAAVPANTDRVKIRIERE
jgi:hypothetical protein